MHSIRNFLLACTFVAGTYVPTQVSAAPYSGVYIFGDSLSDTGNMAQILGSDPTQVITDNSYIPTQPYASGQYTNGNVWVHSFTTALGLPSGAVPSLLGGGNFAFGGARTATDGLGLPPSLSTQTDMFLGLVGGNAPSQALYVVEGGANDVRGLLAEAAVSPTPNVVIANGALAYANSIGQIVDRLQAAGAQNIVVWDVPDLGSTPAVKSFGTGASFLGSHLSVALNKALFGRLASETNVDIFDVYGLQNSVYALPSAYGLSNVTDACGAVLGCDASSYFFWDGIHPTAAMHSILAQGMLDSLSSPVPEPSTALLLVAGVLVIGWQLRRQGQGAAPVTRLTWT